MLVGSQTLEAESPLIIRYQHDLIRMSRSPMSVLMIMIQICQFFDAFNPHRRKQLSFTTSPGSPKSHDATAGKSSGLVPSGAKPYSFAKFPRATAEPFNPLQESCAKKLVSDVSAGGSESMTGSLVEANITCLSTIPNAPGTHDMTVVADSDTPVDELGGENLLRTLDCISDQCSGDSRTCRGNESELIASPRKRQKFLSGSNALETSLSPSSSLPSPPLLASALSAVENDGVVSVLEDLNCNEQSQAVVALPKSRGTKTPTSSPSSPSPSSSSLGVQTNADEHNIADEMRQLIGKIESVRRK